MDRKVQQLGFNWGKYLTDKKSFAAPVHLFNHAQMASNWNEIDCGVKVEVLNTDCPVSSKVYWIAEIIRVAGYKALLRYEGYGDDSQYDFWCNLCTHDVHAVGWCATVGKPLVPPRDIQFKYSNWKNFLIQRLTGSKTLPNDFNTRITKSLDCSFKKNMRLEVMDKTQISRKRIGIVEEVIGGRLRLQYEDSDEAIDDFWCHSNSFLIHPVGWSERIGHRILVANKEYRTIAGFPNAGPELFASVKSVKSCGFKVGMKLEAIDPLNLSSICVATVQKVLKDGYLMIGIDGSMATGGSDWFCFHCTSPSIFPIGYCKANDISLSTPNNYKNVFRWSDYLEATESKAAPASCFLKENIMQSFVPGMKLEAVDLMEPRLLCVATVSRVVGRLLQIHFDGWEAEYDQWIDCQSPDIFPVGWCEMVDYSLQAPANYRVPLSGETERNKRKNKARNQGFSGKKKRKKLSASDKKDFEDTIDLMTSEMTSENDKKEVVVGKKESLENRNGCDVEMKEGKSSPVGNRPKNGDDPSKDLDFTDELKEKDYLDTAKNLGPPPVPDNILDDLEQCEESDILSLENSPNSSPALKSALDPKATLIDKPVEKECGEGTASPVAGADFQREESEDEDNVRITSFVSLKKSDHGGADLKLNEVETPAFVPYLPSENSVPESTSVSNENQPVTDDGIASFPAETLLNNEAVDTSFLVDNNEPQLPVSDTNNPLSAEPNRNT